METKRFVFLLAFGLLLLYGWNIAFNAIGKRMGYDMSARKPAVAASTEPTTQASSRPASSEESVFANPATLPGGFDAVGSASRPAEQVTAIGSTTRDDPTYALALDATNRGAGLDRVVLNKYQATIYSPDPYAFERPGTSYPDRTRSLAVRGVNIDGTEIDLTDATWTPVSNDRSAAGQQSATYQYDVTAGGKPVVRLSRTYTVFAQPKDPADGLDSHGLEIRVYDAFKNLTDKPITVALRYNAPPVPPTEAERIADSYIVLATAEGDYASARGYPSGSISVDNPHDLVKDYADHGRPWYLGSMTGYFAALQRFEPELNGKAPADRIESFVLRRLTSKNAESGTPIEDELLVSLKPITVAANAETGFGSRVYFGPKKREWLTNAYYKQPWIQFDQVLALRSSWWICGLCTWQWLVNILFSVLTTLHWVVRDWGLSIVLLTCIVRLCLHPVTKRAQMSMLSFGKHAPEMAKIKERYKDDQEAMQKAMWAFQREHGMKQVMGCLPMFLQAPIWIALWSAMSSTFELRHQPFLYGLTWIHDLSRPDHLIDFGQTFHMPILSMITISGLNVLPLLFGVLQFIQFKTQPQPPSMTEEQRQQQQMTQWMMLTLFPLFMYGSPSGLLIYMITSFTIGIIESKLIKREFNRREAEAAKFQVVDAEAAVAGGKPASPVQKATVRRKADNGPKRTGLAGMLDEWKRKAEEMQREIEKNRGKRPR